MVNIEKFKNLILYITSKCQSLDNFGKTVLYKMLYFSDFDFYEKYDRAITNEEYIKYPHGPLPADFDKIIKEMKVKNEIREIRGDYYGKTQSKFIPLKKPNLGMFDTLELDIVNNVICRLSGMDASNISAYSHGDMPWKATKDKSCINYQLVFYRDDLYSVRDYGEGNKISEST